MTQRALIDAVGVSGGKLSSGHLAEIESGNRGASRDKLEELALAMSLTPEEHASLLAAAGLPVEGGNAMVMIVQRVAKLEVAVKDLTAMIERLEDMIPGAS